MSRIVGIDLGTSTSEISYIAEGRPVVIPNTLGKLITPSVVHIAEDGEALVGEPAAEYLLTRPDCTFMEVKRLTGSGETLEAHGKKYTPEEIQAKLLRYLADCAEAHIGEKVTRAVITVPAYFTDAQRRATVKAGELAGLKVERIINEPTAAALDYGLANLSQSKRIMVYDLGGGTLDITVLELFEGVIEVSASCGNNRLGGKDFDETLLAHLGNAKGDMRAFMRLKRAAEDCKIALSDAESYEVNVPFLRASKSKKPVSVEKTVTRAEFENMIRQSVESTRAPLKQALADSRLAPSDLDIVLLVGGSTRIPLVKRFVGECAGIEPKTLVDPDLTVARGAAIQAGIIEGALGGGFGGFNEGGLDGGNGGLDDGGLVLIDICPYTLGTEIVHETGHAARMVFDPIIPRNTPIPVEKSTIYYPAHDYQTAVQIRVFQGESSDANNNEKLGEVMLSGIPSAKSGRQPVKVTFAYDINGILQVTAQAVTTGKEISVEINTAGVEAMPELDLSQWSKTVFAKLHRPVLRKAEKRIAAGEDVDGELALLVSRLKEAILLKDEAKADDLRDELLDAMEFLDEYDDEFDADFIINGLDGEFKINGIDDLNDKLNDLLTDAFDEALVDKLGDKLGDKFGDRRSRQKRGSAEPAERRGAGIIDYTVHITEHIPDPEDEK